MKSLTDLAYIPVIICLGQSNAEGRAPKANAPEGWLNAAQGSMIWKGVDAGLESYDVGQIGIAGNHNYPDYAPAVNTTQFGPISIAIQNLEKRYDQPYVVFQYAMGGQALLKAAGESIGVGYFDPQENGLWNSVEREWKYFTSHIEETYGMPIRVEFAFWCQGEADHVVASTTPGTYKAALQRLISSTRSLAANDDLPFIIMMPVRYDLSSSSGGPNIIRYEQAEIALSDPNVAVTTCALVPDVYGATLNDVTIDLTHINAPVMIQEGNRIANIYAAKLEGVSTPSAVTGLAASGQTDTTIDLSWSGSGSREYVITAGGTVVGFTAGSSITIEGLTLGTSYTFRVYSLSIDFQTAYAEITTATTGASEEITDLQSAYSTVEASEKLDNRYGTDTLNPVAFSTYAALFSSVGDTFRDPTFGTLIKVAATAADQINMERPHQNADGTRWFFKTGTSRWEIFDNNGDKVGGNRNLAYNSTNPTDGVRWHPTNPDILFYPIGSDIIYYDISDDSQTVAFTSPVGSLGTGNRRLAGGDGNIAVKVGSEARILVTHGGKNTDCQVIVLDDWEVVTQSWNGSAWVESKVPWNASAPKFDLPAGTLFDYATLTLPDQNGDQFIVAAADGLGTDLFNLSGTLIDAIDSNSNHMNQVYYRSGGVDHLAMVKKTVSGMIPPAVNVGDAQIWWYDVDMSVNPQTVTINGVVGLDWDSGYNQAGGGQYGNYASDRTCLLAMNSAVEEGATDWQKYYSEVVEIQLDGDGDASDNVPRRVLHHMIDTFGTVGGQPEAWYANDGTHGFFKSDVGGELSNNGYLFWFELKARTPVASR